MSHNLNLKNEIISIGIDENLSDDEILEMLQAEFDQETQLNDQQLQYEIASAKNAHTYLSELKSPNTEDSLLKQKILFAMRKEKELQTLRQSYYQTQLLFAVAIVILLSCYSALWIQQKELKVRFSNLHPIQSNQPNKSQF